MIKDKNILYISAYGLLARMLLFLVFYTHVTMYPDSTGYTDLAEHITSLTYSDYDGMRTPGYALLIALSFGNLYITVFYQFIIGILTAVAWYLLLLNLRFSKKQSLYITLFLQTFIHVYFFETAILMESLVLFLTSLVFYLITIQKPTFVIHLLLGVIFGFLVLTKPFYLFMPFLFYGFWFLKEPRNYRALVSRFIVLVFPILAYLGWSSVIKTHHGYFSSTTLMGIYLAQNCVRFAEKSPDDFKWLSEPYVTYREKSIAENKDIAMSIWYAYDDGAYDKYQMPFSEISNEFAQYAKVTIANNPMEYLHQVIFYSWRDFWKPTIYWNYNDFNFKNANRYFLAIWNIQKPILYIFRALFLVLVPILIIKAIKNRTMDVGFIIMSVIFIASVLQALLTYGTNNRFSFPFEFLIIITVVMYFRDREWWFLKPLVNKLKF
ncbi:hypothetical protein [Bizionia myxarmorum]|uniref:Glycosyltransferase family 39 protein n=1 Tax=Bizionia myxarmorum TaxID=291186 RepID=A0A5D0R7K0_9FLAO|nr:hypothetical protein [Bizionia myxarmorum]TYB76861.1 hypothetical protein ES674_09115 [Bizionia myxarmorum]